MNLGFTLPMCGNWATPDNQVEIAQKAEQLGYSTVWTLQRLLFPVEPQNDYPPMEGQPWPDAFRRVVDPIVSLAHVAAVTSRIGLGTGAVIAPYYSPIVLGKQLAMLDQVSRGRLLVGLGLGWSMDEYQATGVPFERRGARMDEFVECLRAVFADEVVSYSGEFYDIPPSFVEPKPTQRPSPPLLIGGYGQASLRRAAQMGDGFIGGNLPMTRVASLVADLRAGLENSASEDRQFLFVSRGTTLVHDEPQGEDRRPLFGSIDEVRRDIEAYAEAGLDELFIELNYDPAMANPSADPRESVQRAHEIMEALAPGR